MKLFKTSTGNILKSNGQSYLIEEGWDLLINREDLFKYLNARISTSNPLSEEEAAYLIAASIEAPIGTQEVWAAGVTYLRSRDARMEESKDAGGADFYSKVYNADRPELFFKALPHRVAAPGGKVLMRKDSQWNVPEPELTLFINSNGKIQGYTIGNDMSSRDIEGENPLYLPQAKVYNKSAALGPCLYVPKEPISLETNISIVIKRSRLPVFENDIQLNRMKRNFDELAEYLFRECDFENGAFLMTGTGIVPSNDFTLQVNDEIEITIDHIGTLKNIVGIQ